MKELRIAVVGAGRMGTNHARVLAEMPDVKLVTVCDADAVQAQRTGRRFLAESSCGDIAQMLADIEIDAAIVAVPTPEHCSVAELCLKKGIDLLVEKPMASTVDECDHIIGTAKAHNRVLMVGHIERFNPAIVQLKDFLDNRFLGDVYYVETTRAGPFPKRLYGSKDGVVIDLAVHDLDLVAYLFGSLSQLYANCISTPDKHQDIHARVLFKTSRAVGGTSQFSWISPKRERSMTVYGDKGVIVCNLIDQELWYYENGDVEIDYSDNYYQNVLMGKVSEGKVIKFPIKREEPLRSELSFFLSLVRDRREHDPSYGKAAVRYSLSVLESAREDRIVHFS